MQLWLHTNNKTGAATKDLLDVVLGAPITTLLVVAGLVFLLIAVVGNVAGKIEPGKTGRVASGVIGAVLLAIGLGLTVARLDDRGNKDDNAKETRQAAEAEARKKSEEEKRRQAEAQARAKVQRQALLEEQARKQRQAAEAEARRKVEERQRQAEADARAKARKEALEEQARRSEEPRTVLMPNLVGMSMGDAESLLRRAVLTHRGARPELSAKVPAGTVVRQMPSAGQRVRLDTQVILVYANEWNHPVPIQAISSDGEARGVCPAACARVNGKWSGKWFGDTRGGGTPRFYCGCAV